MGCCNSTGEVEGREKDVEIEEEKTKIKTDSANEQQGSTGSNNSNTNANSIANTNAKNNSNNNSNSNDNNNSNINSATSTNTNINDNKTTKTNSVIDTKQGDGNPSEEKKDSKPKEKNVIPKNSGVEAEQVTDSEYEMYLKRDVTSIKNLFEKYAKVKSIEVEDEQYMNKEGLENALLSLGIKLMSEDTRMKVFEYFNFKSAEEETEEEVGSKVGCIDFFDFCSCLNALVDENDRESASILFLCFDWDHDGFLTLVDVVRLLLAQHLLLATIHGGFQSPSITRYTKSNILDRSRALFQRVTDQTDPVTQLTFENFMDVMNTPNHS